MENLEKWCRRLWVKKSLTLKCLARVSPSKVSSENTPYNFVGNEGIYSEYKEFRKALFVFAKNNKFRGYLVRWRFLWSTYKMTGWHDSSTSNHELHMCIFTGTFTRELVAKLHLSSLRAWFFTSLSHSSFTIKPTKI